MANALISAAHEEWRVVPSCPQVEASSWGRIRRKDHIGIMPHGGSRAYTSEPTYGTVRRAHKTAAHSYRGYIYRGIGNVKVHRMVCEAFHGPAPHGKPYVLHLDEDAHNNRPENLKWGTQKENLSMPRIKAWREANLSRPKEAR